MTEAIYRHGRIAFHHKNDAHAEHDIFVSPNFTAAHYTHDTANVVISTVTLNTTLNEITCDGDNTVLHFESVVGGTFTITLPNTTPEALCDAVEAARLQAVKASAV